MWVVFEMDDYTAQKGLPEAPDCFFLGGKVHLAAGGRGHRLGGIGEPYCIMMHTLPCTEECPDRRVRGNGGRGPE